MAESYYKFYSLGIVAKDKPTSVDVIDVTPIEHITEIEGDINVEKDYKSTAVDHKGKPQIVSTKAKNTLTAKWVPIGCSNRSSSPDVIQGETVMIYTYSDTNEYYWSTIFNEPKIRRLEKVLYSWCNLSKGARVTEYDRTTSYWAEVDTMNKYVKFHTSDNDGEFTTYDVHIDTKNGSFSVTDGLGNHFKIDSNAGIIEAKDKGGNFISVNSNNNRVEAIAGKAVIIKAPVIILDGAVGTTGGISGSGNLSINGNIDAGGRIASNGVLTASGGCQASEHPKSSEGATLTPIPSID